jgi:hypothetical protein
VTDTNGLPEDWWTTDDVAHYLSVTPSTVRAYLARKQMQEPDRRMGRMRLWRPASIRDWAREPPTKVTTSACQRSCQTHGHQRKAVCVKHLVGATSVVGPCIAERGCVPGSA